MIHARDDYNRIQDPAIGDPSLLGDGCSPIAEDEPVFLLRARDKAMMPMLAAYYKATAMNPHGDLRMLDSITEHMHLVKKWQTEHEAKTADLPRSL